MMRSIPRLRIVVVYPYKFTDNYYRKYEIEFLKKNCEVEVWDIGYFLHPRFVAAIAAQSSNDECVRTVKNWADLFRLLKNLRCVQCDKVVFFQFSQSVNFRAFISNLLIKFRADCIVDFYNAGVPILESVQSSILTEKHPPYVLSIYSKLIRRIKAREYARLYRELLSRFMSLMVNLVSIRPTHRLIAGRAMEKKYRIEAEQMGIKVLMGLSWDFSNSLAYEASSCQPLVRGRYAVLLDGAGPAYASDDELIGRKPIVTSDKWYPALVSFFEHLESEAKVKIVVAAHPKSKLSNNPKEFGFRQVFYGYTEELVKHAAFVITRFSTAVSYAVMYEKPVLIIYNEQMKSHAEVFKSLCAYADILGVSPINIDAPPASTLGYLSISKDAYSQYKYNYLTTLSDPYPNYRIIVGGLLGLNNASYA